MRVRIRVPPTFKVSSMSVEDAVIPRRFDGQLVSRHNILFRVRPGQRLAGHSGGYSSKEIFIDLLKKQDDLSILSLELVGVEHSTVFAGCGASTPVSGQTKPTH